MLMGWMWNKREEEELQIQAIWIIVILARVERRGKKKYGDRN